jgi:hypothetical protein
MKLVIKPVTTNQEELDAMHRIRHEVFEREHGIALSGLQSFGAANALHLLARVGPGGEPAAALTVVETSGDRSLYERYGLGFGPQARTARYTQLAVREQFRGMSLPLRLIFEAHHRFIAPGGFDHTWLLFNADAAASSSLCRELAFVPSQQVFPSEYGMARTLVRDEALPRAQQAIRQVRQLIELNRGVFR